MKKLFTIALMLCFLTTIAQDVCKATKKDGTPCKGRPDKSGYCIFHDPAHRCTVIKNNGERCKGLRVKGTEKCYIHSNK